MLSPYELQSPVGETWIKKIKRIVKETAAPLATAVDSEGRFPEETIQALAKEGFLGLTVPKEFGGGGATPSEVAAVVEELGTACGSSAMVYVMHISGCQAIINSSTLKNKKAILEAICRGEHLTTLAFSEKGSRSEFWTPVSEIEWKEGTGYTNAFKSWITSAGHAQSYVSSARNKGAKSGLESTLYLVDAKAKGVKIAGTFLGVGLRGNESAPVMFQELKVESDSCLTETGKGAEGMLQVVLPWFIVGTSAMAHGLCLAAIKATSEHLTQTAFDDGRKLRDLPNLRARLAQMNLKTQQSRAFLGWTLCQMAHPTETTPLAVLQARLSALQTAVEVTDLAMKTCGGAAFSKHLSLERIFRDARAGWVMAPTVDHLEDFVGKALTGLPLF